MKRRIAQTLRRAADWLAPASPIGSMTVSVRADTTQFSADMDRAIKLAQSQMPAFRA